MPTRRIFLETAGCLAAGASLGYSGPGDRINIAVAGLRGRGKDHYRAYAKMPGVRVAYLCDIDQRLFPEALDAVEKIAGYRPATEVDLRKILERKDVDAVSLATPDYWHALQTVWACQAGKDVYVEKPVCFTVTEGRRMVEAARKYNRIVQAGLNYRSDRRYRAGVRYIRDGSFGKPYRANAVVFRGRASIGRVKESSIPTGVNWDLFLGPAPYRAFNMNRFHYGWHYFWDTSTTEVGANGVHIMDTVRWALDKNEHPVKIHCVGGLYADDSDQETPNVQNASFEYADGTLVELEVTTHYSPTFGGVSYGAFFYTARGYVTSANDWSTVVGEFTPRNSPDPPSGISLHAVNMSFPDIAYKPGPPIPDLNEGAAGALTHFENFISCVRSRKREDLHTEILEGHRSTALCLLANISYRTGRKLVFDPATETFPGDAEANRYLTRQYRAPYVVPDKV
jgi:predicted dehydrogenase